MKIFSFRRMLTFGLGAAAGYYLGNRQGREQAQQTLQQAKEYAQQLWTDPKTQEGVHEAAEMVTDAIREKSPKLGEYSEKATDLIDKSTGYSQDPPRDTDSTKADPANERAGHETVQAGNDVVSDPAASLEEEGGTTGTRQN